MIALRRLYFKSNLDQTVRYNKTCIGISAQAPCLLNAVIADSLELAINILKYDIMSLLYETFQENDVIERYADFTYQIHYTEIINGRVNLTCWQWDGKEYYLK